MGLEKTSTGKNGLFKCPENLKYNFSDLFKLKCSELCCKKMKKEPSMQWAKDNNKNITITGMRAEEGGARMTLNCIVTDKDGKIKKFHPLVKVNEEWEEWFIKKYNIKLCKLYYPPFSFKRTGCKGCPFALNLENELNTLENYLPNERKQCEYIWGPVYNEYRRIGFRLKNKEQLKLF